MLIEEKEIKKKTHSKLFILLWVFIVRKEPPYRPYLIRHEVHGVINRSRQHLLGPKVD